MNRYNEINERLKEIRSLLESDKQDLNLDALEAELRSLAAEKDTIEQRREHFKNTGRPMGSQGESFTMNRDGSFKSLFRNAGANDRGHGFKNFGDFLRAVNSGRYDDRLEKRQMVGQLGQLGGFAVPEELGGWLFDTSIEQEIIRPRATVWPVNSDTFRAPAWNGNDHSNALFGGLTGAWLAEAALAGDEEAALREIKLEPKKLAVFVSVSNELLADSSIFEAQLKNAMGSTLSYQLDRAFLTGGGGGQPLGILNHPSVINVPRATANQVTYPDIISMFSRLHPALQPGAVWICSNTVLPEMLAMEDTGNHLVWHPDGAGAAPRTLLGREVIFTEKLPGLGSSGDVLLCNLKQYAIGLRAGIGFEKSNSPGWQRDLSSFRAIVRVDGQPAWTEPVTPVGGGDTLSWAVQLGAV